MLTGVLGKLALPKEGRKAWRLAHSVDGGQPKSARGTNLRTEEPDKLPVAGFLPFLLNMTAKEQATQSDQIDQTTSSLKTCVLKEMAITMKSNPYSCNIFKLHVHSGLISENSNEQLNSNRTKNISKVSGGTCRCIFRSKYLYPQPAH